MENDTMSLENGKEKEAMRMHITEDHLAEFSEHVSIPLPSRLEQLYGGTLDFVNSPKNIIDHPLLYVNFVMSREGIFNVKDHPGGGPISQGNKSDAFTMALLRSHADAIMVGASTLRSEPGHLWTADFIFDVFPQMQGMDDVRTEFQHWRQDVKNTDEYPPVFFMTNSGDINPHAAAMNNDRIASYIVTNKKGAHRVTQLLGGSQNTKILTFGDDDLDEAAMLKSLRNDFGVEFLLHEGGRGAVNSLAQQGHIDQLFLTHMRTSPQGDSRPENTQYLFERGDHQPPHELRLMTAREDEAGLARLYNFDARNLRAF